MTTTPYAPVQLPRLWFAMPPSRKPKRVYLILTDRVAHTKFKPNAIAIP